jgi:RNA polymerase sigma factor (sigma-70 family)
MATRRIARRIDEQTEGFESARRRLLSLAYRMLGSRAEAEDVVQEAWLRWRTAPHEALRTPAAWLTTVTVRLSIDRIRSLEREREYWDAPIIREPWAESHAPSAESIVADAALLTDGLARMYAHLSTDERAALLLFEAFDCNYDEIARVLSRRVDACRQLVRRAKLRLQSPDLPSTSRVRPVGANLSAKPRLTPDGTPILARVQLRGKAGDRSRDTTQYDVFDGPVNDREFRPADDVIERIRAAIANQDKHALIGMMLDEVAVVAANMDTTDVDVAHAIAEVDRAPISAVAANEVDCSATAARSVTDADRTPTTLISEFNGALTAKTGSFEITSKSVAAGDLAETCFSWIARGGSVESMALQGRPGLAFLDGCHIVMAIGFVLRAGRIACCLVMDGPTLHVLNETYDPMRVLNRVMSTAAARIEMESVLV